MAAMRTVGNGRTPPPHAHVRENEGRYLIELDVSGFVEEELTVELLGRTVTVRGEQVETVEDVGKAFRLRERLTESFRLPDDAVLDQTKVFYKHGTLEIRVPRTTLEPRRLPVTTRSRFAINPSAEPC